ncbi:MAG TPA: VTT domain-containing protein [Azospirillaceae bacterium]|nr:VTT domain-containing protein [Azospirillaceae bacterium]
MFEAASALSLASATDRESRPILVPGKTCWRLERAERVAFLIDGAAYFEAAKTAMLRARRSILLVGWDLDTRIRFEPRKRDDSGPIPDRLGDFLDWLAERRWRLHIHCLKWDYATIYALERQPVPNFLLDWASHPRVHYRLDSAHPTGACQHQKLLVIDDRLAFCGGLDLTKNRWDTPAHRDHEPCRIWPDGTPYDPFHDLMMAVDGPAAAALGDLARERWRRATGRRLRRHRTDHDPWPSALRPDMRHVEVAIARTDPPMPGRAEVREVEALYAAAITAACRSIYLESQYFASHRVAAALAERLQEPDGPDVVVINPVRTTGWLEHAVMGMARDRLSAWLRSVDRGNRFRLLAPVTEEGRIITVHSKLMIIDDRLIRIGSANLNNRSMGLDSECDLAIEILPGAPDPHGGRRALRRLRQRLVAEHLGVSPDLVAAHEAATGSLTAAIDRLRRPVGRTLVMLESGRVDGWTEALVDSHLLDPERPVGAELLTRPLLPAFSLPSLEPPRRWRRALAVAGVALVVAGLLALWRYTPLGRWATVDNVLALLHALGDGPLGPVVLIALYIAGGLAAFPVTVLIAATAIVYGPWWGFVTALAGATASAAVTFWIGRAVGARVVRRLAGPAVARVSRRLAERGIVTVAVLRIVPVAPFTVVNLVAGVSHLRFRDYLIGTVVGMAPGTLALSAFGGQIERVVRNPRPSSLLLLAALGVGVVGLGWLARRWVRSRGYERRAGRQDGRHHGAHADRP